VAFNEREVCILTVNNKLYTEWKSITVYKCRKEAFDYYRFTCSEFAAFAKDLAAQQIRPGDECTVTLGGEYAIGGYVTTRQVAFTEKSHGVEITGKSYTSATVNGAASTKGGELTDVTYTELANKLLQPYGLKFEPKDNISQEKFPRVNVTGQTVWEVLEKAARQRSIILGTSPKPNEGNIYWGTTPTFSAGQGVVEEGVNMLEGRETLSMEFGSGAYLTMAQAAPTPQKWGPEITSAPLGKFASEFASRLGVAPGFKPLVSMAEMPGGQSAASQRSGAENSAISGEQIKVEVVVQGWFNANRVLWLPWNSVYVRSPMLIMDQSLICKSVTFNQDDKGGTRTTLELENEMGAAGPKLN